MAQDWIEPYVLVALGCHLVAMLLFVAAMLVTGHRHRAVRKGFRAPADAARTPETSYEELGFLVGGTRRMVEVALLRLCLFGHVDADGWLVLVRDPDLCPATGPPEPVGGEVVAASDALLRILRRRPRVLLPNLLAGAERAMNSREPPPRLVELGLVDVTAHRVARLREGAFAWYFWVYVATMVAFVGSVAIGIARAELDHDPARGTVISVGVFFFGVAVTGLAARTTGGLLDSVTRSGRDVVVRAKRYVPEPVDERVLHQVALRGLNTVPEFERAANHGDLDAGIGPRTKAFMNGINLTVMIAQLLSGAGGGKNR